MFLAAVTLGVDLIAISVLSYGLRLGAPTRGRHARRAAHAY